MVMINTRIHSSGADGSDPLNPKYIMVVVQVRGGLGVGNSMRIGPLHLAARFHIAP